MKNNVGIILQARVGSYRLPGKALAQIGSRTVVEHCIRRLISSGVGRVVLATTKRREDDALELIASQLGAPVFRGSTEDVLERYAETAAQFGFEHIVRATGDNPCVDIQAAGRLLNALTAMNADFACEKGLPYGADVEVMTRDALFRAAASAQHPYEREHVTIFIKKRPDEFHVVQQAAPRSLTRPDLRVTIDTRDDLLYVRELYRRTGSEMPGLRDLIDVAGRAERLEVA